MTWKTLFIITSGLMILIYGPAVYALPMNGDFSAQLADWTTLGNVQAEAGAAVLGDEGEYYSALYQAVGASAGTYTIEFDFFNALSDDIPNFAFADVFFASLYFIDDVDAFNLETFAFDDALALFDMDSIGPYNNNGTIETSVVGEAWLHFSLTFENAYEHIIPTFEFMDGNFIDSDSRVWIDNVQITATAVPVPEPGTGFLLIAGFCGLIIMRPASRHLNYSPPVDDVC